MNFNNKVFLITGGTGSFGRAFSAFLLKSYKPKKIIIFSRDEFLQFQMSKEKIYKKNEKIMRFFIGDVRDYKRLEYAMYKVDYVIHAAALKQVPTAEYNPDEFVKTNIIGAQNVIDACIANNVKKVTALSTDKAAAPINLYGATKLCSDKLFTSANNKIGNRKIIFSVVRYGNVMGSRGSVIPYFMSLKKSDIFPITDTRMTRFNITMNESIKLVLFALTNGKGSEIFVPKIPSYKILDVAKAINVNCKTEVVGIRAGEKIHEEMITESDSNSTFDLGHCFAIVNPSNGIVLKYYKTKKNVKKVPENFSYNSGENNHNLTVKQLKDLIKKL
tara:strand:- start:107 stop:1099 length:993 start_codon:yes stop_codon:yes gene_type:complete